MDEEEFWQAVDALVGAVLSTQAWKDFSRAVKGREERLPFLFLSLAFADPWTNFCVPWRRSFAKFSPTTLFGCAARAEEPAPRAPRLPPSPNREIRLLNFSFLEIYNG